MTRKLSILLVLWVVAGCESEAERARRLAEEQAQAERALFEQRRAEVLSAPDRFLATSELAYFDKGIINDYRQLIAVTVTNRAAVPIRVSKARVVWLSDDGEEVGISPLTLNGTLTPGSEMKFSASDGTLTSGTIQGNASKARIEFTQVEVVTPVQL